MSKFTCKGMKELHEKLMKYPSYKDNKLILFPGGDGNSILVARLNVIKLAEDTSFSLAEVIDEFDNYEELAAFMAGVTWSYYKG